MIKKNKIKLPLFISGGFFLFDQILKYLVRANPQFSFYLWEPWLGWEYYENPGIAFNLPMPNTTILILTPLILLGLSIIFLKKKNPAQFFILAFFLIILGAISNFIDRMLFGITIDYLRVFTAVINTGDIMIVIGVITLMFGDKILKKQNGVTGN